MVEEKVRKKKVREETEEWRGWEGKARQVHLKIMLLCNAMLLSDE